MLSDRNIAKINSQIESELRIVEGFLNSEEKKLAALARIVKLQALLTEQPSVTIDYNKLANVIIGKMDPSPRVEPSPLLAAVIAAINRR